MWRERSSKTSWPDAATAHKRPQPSHLPAWRALTDQPVSFNRSQELESSSHAVAFELRPATDFHLLNCQIALAFAGVNNRRNKEHRSETCHWSPDDAIRIGGRLKPD